MSSSKPRFSNTLEHEDQQSAMSNSGSDNSGTVLPAVSAENDMHWTYYRGQRPQNADERPIRPSPTDRIFGDPRDT